MIDAYQYLQKIKEYFLFLITEFDFDIIEENINGNYYYEIQYSNTYLSIYISYENIENYYQVTIYKLINNKKPSYNDKFNVFNLNKLNTSLFRTLTNQQIISNNNFFNHYKTTNNVEYQLLKSAKELRLCLKNLDKLCGTLS